MVFFRPAWLHQSGEVQPVWPLIGPSRPSRLAVRYGRFEANSRHAVGIAQYGEIDSERTLRLPLGPTEFG